MKNRFTKKLNLSVIMFLMVFPALFFLSCESVRSLEGNWETVALIKDGIKQEIIPSNIKFVFKDKTIKAKGDAGVNLFNANVNVKGKTFKASNMENTGLMGLSNEMEYEDLFFQVLMNADSYKIEDNFLYLYASSKNMEIQLKRK